MVVAPLAEEGRDGWEVERSRRETWEEGREGDSLRRRGVGVRRTCSRPFLVEHQNQK